MAESVIIASMAASTGIQAYGTYQSGKAAEKQAEYNAQLAERDAQIQENNLLDFDKLVDHEVGKMRREYNAYRGANQIAFVRSGVRLDSGGTVDVINRENLETYIDDEYAFKYNAAKEKQMRVDGAAMERIRGASFRSQGKYARAAANLNTVGSLLQGGSDTATTATLLS